MTDNEIIKALECCSNYNDCDKCNFEPKDNKKKTIGCCLETMKNALDFITRQKTENENLKVEDQSLRSAANSLKMHYEEAQAEIESLKIFRGYAEKRASDYKTMRDKYLNAKSEAVKEVFEKLNKKAKVGKIIDKKFPFIIRVVTLHDINELKREMVGEDND